MTRAGKHARAGAVTVLAMVLAACGDGSTDAGDDLASSEHVTSYFDALASRPADWVDEMLGAAEPGSPAHTFARHEAGGDRAAEAAGLDRPEPVPREVVDGEIVLGSHPDTSIRYSDFEVDDETGRLTDFSARFTSSDDAASPISERVTAGDGTTIAVGDGTIELLTVHLGLDYPDLRVTLEVRSGREPLRISAEAVPLVELPPLPGRAADTGGAVTWYEDRAGVEHALTVVLGPGGELGFTDLPAQTTTVLVLGFEDAGPGGTIFLPVGRAGELHEVAIPVPRP